MKSTQLRMVRLLGVVALMCALASATAQASFAAGPQLRINAPWPDSVENGGIVQRDLAIENAGDETTSGQITLTDSFGLGFEGLTIGFGTEVSVSVSSLSTEGSCEVVALTVNCTIEGSLPPGAQALVNMSVKVAPEAAGALTNTISAAGGGTPTQTVEQISRVASPGPFGFDHVTVDALSADGSEDNQAASVPADFTSSLEWQSFAEPSYESELADATLAPDERFNDVVMHLPPGFIGDPAATPALCTADEMVQSQHINGQGSNIPACPPDSQVGIVHLYIAGHSKIVTLYNMVPPYGVASELGFQAYQTSVLLYGYVRPQDHGIDIVSKLTSTSAPITRADVTVWGDPFSPSHFRYREECMDGVLLFGGATGLSCPTAAPRKAFLRMPTSCSGAPLSFSAESNSYEHEDVFATAQADGPQLKGCELVPFAPQITVDPTGTAANSPTGVAVKLSLPQSENPDGLAEADLKKAVVTLPEGMAINPSSADGLQACDDAHLRLDSNTPAECPDGSKIGTVLLHTQLISNPIEGLIYLRPQNSNDPMSGEMFRIAIELRDDAHGLDFKVPGQIQANPTTGRLTTTFDENPQLPFQDISLQFKAGARAPLVTPASCQAQTTEADLYSWAQPDVAVHRSNTFNLTSGAEGAPCPGASPPFAPSVSSGVTDVEAGAFTSFLTTFSRKDSDQSLQHVSVTMPKGLSGSLAGLPLCGEAQADAGTCGPESQIGTVTVGAGAGPTPFYVTGGRVYMTGPYGGAPFGLSIVVPTKAGPFDLGNVVTRAKIEVDPHTAQLTVASDPLPQIVGGVPVNLRLVNVTIDRPDFVLNPTNCANSSVLGTMIGGQGASVTLSNPFQVTNCAALRFKPKLTASTSGHTSRARGASLNVRLSYPANALGNDANIASVRVELPRALPSRLTTLNHACPDDVFDRNPAGCSPESRVGYAHASTPILPVPLEGPAYFVSHGGQKFPELTVVLQGDGVTIDLDGETFISNAGITSSTFNQVPDVPVDTFELKLPQGRFSALAANTDLCSTNLAMPTTFRAQNGAGLRESTPIAAQGCPYALHLVHRTVKKRTLTLKVFVPQGGRLSASGPGLSSASKQAKGPQALTLTLKERPAGRGGRTKVLLRFVPRTGKQRGILRKSVIATFR